MDRFKAFFNFDNVGSKIKNFTKWACWISIIVIWIAVGVCILVSMTDEPYGLGIGAIVGGGILTFTTWIGSWVMYGFGEIVENATHKGRSVTPKVTLKTGDCDALAQENNEEADEGAPLITGRCWICRKNPVKVRTYLIKDEWGVAYRHVCDHCAEKKNLR